MEGGDEQPKDESLPPGFRFHPTDEELITYYLVNKISDATFACRAVADVDLNKCEPWDLPGKAKMGEKEWYFFSLRDRKYPTGVRTNRATNTGYWKTTGKDKEIYNSVSTELVGMKKTLVFYRGRAPRGEKTNWVMHEYRVHSRSAYRSAKDEWVVCRVFQKSAGVKKYPTTQSTSSRAINLEMGHNNNHAHLHSHLLPSPIMPLPLDPATAAHFNNLAGRNYMMNDQLAELSRALRNGGGGGGGGGFTISGLNLNLGAAAQPPLRPPMIHQQHDAANSSMLNAYAPLDMNMNMNMNDHAASSSSRFINVDNCVEFDSYWPTY